jgi:hypothetical protein
MKLRSDTQRYSAERIVGPDPGILHPSTTALRQKECAMIEGFRKLPGKERLEFGLTMALIVVGMLAVAAVLFG